jgi:hypothetical protein
MVDLALLQSVSYIAGALGVCVAAVFYVLNLRISQTNMKNTLETRQAQILMSLYQKWSEPEFQEAFDAILSVEYSNFDDYMSKYGAQSNPDFYRKQGIVESFLEGLGVFVKRGFIDASLVDDMMSMHVVSFWQKLGPVLVEFRKRFNVPTNDEHIEYMYNVVYEIWMKQHPETPKPFSSL